MAAGTYIKALVLIVVSLLVFGFASSTVVHNQIWDGVKTVLGEFGIEGDGDEGGATFFEYPLSVSYNLTQTITVQHNGTVNNLSLKTPSPINSWNTLNVQTVNSWGLMDSGFGEDDSIRQGWTYYTYNSTIPSPFSFDIYYNFQSNFAIWNVTPNMSGTLADIPSWYNDTYLKDQEWVINSNTVGINRSQASGAVSEVFGTDEEDNVLKILHDAYIWVVSNIVYNTTGGDLRSVSQTYETKAGDCDDMSTLLVSMVRSKGVPAWLEQGILYNPLTNGWEHHAWVQAYVPLANGSYVNITIDPTNKQFALFTPDKLIVYTDMTGDGDLMGEYYNFMSFIKSQETAVTVEISFTTVNRTPTGSVQVPGNHSTW